MLDRHHQQHGGLHKNTIVGFAHHGPTWASFSDSAVSFCSLPFDFWSTLVGPQIVRDLPEAWPWPVRSSSTPSKNTWREIPLRRRGGFDRPSFQRMPCVT